jgi:hypothetical protein
MNEPYVLLLAPIALWNSPTFISPLSMNFLILFRTAAQEMVTLWQMSSSMSYFGFSVGALRLFDAGLERAEAAGGAMIELLVITPRGGRCDEAMIVSLVSEDGCKC